MPRTFLMGFALVAYAVFLLTFLYLIAFVGDLPWVAVTVDRGPAVAPVAAVVINLGLIALFGLQHSGMARQGFKRAWTRIVSPAAERSIRAPAPGSTPPLRCSARRSRRVFPCSAAMPRPISAR